MTDTHAPVEGGCGWQGCSACYPMPDGGPCPLCGVQVARVLLDGHLAIHEMKGHRLTGPQRVRAAIARDRGDLAPWQTVTLCGTPDGTELRADAPRWRWRLRRLRSGTLALVRLRRTRREAGTGGRWGRG